MEIIFEWKAKDTEALAKRILEKLNSHKVVAFYGTMGAGKTTLIKAICKNLGVSGMVASPTFAILNEYKAANAPVYHFDFYRINSESEAFDLGYENFFFSGNYCFIEWAEKVKTLLPHDRAEIHISLKNKDRLIKMIA